MNLSSSGAMFETKGRGFRKLLFTFFPQGLAQFSYLPPSVPGVLSSKRRGKKWRARRRKKERKKEERITAYSGPCSQRVRMQRCFTYSQAIFSMGCAQQKVGFVLQLKKTGHRSREHQSTLGRSNVRNTSKLKSFVQTNF
ncbi:hypothetical protein OUZ56_020291 [Daphnia magna]|uniref:Uncharacterized protein n=1 Tax=Daphnia magna TaxID=35525 RepID=A0ABQ9ZE29_9CRUS|nr:hypothetical protein OUZ56_020291 [Daphnia magna]